MIRLPKKIISIIFFLSLLIFPFLLSPHKISAQQEGDLFKPFDVGTYIENEEQAQEIEKNNPDEMPVFSDRAERTRVGAILGGILSYTTDMGAVNKGRATAMGTVTDLIATIYEHPPASGLAYTQYILANAGLAAPAYAQGIGFAGLKPLLPLWNATRNIAYSALIIVMIVIGFMIIFRMKIDPKTIITVQAAIPRIVVTILLITLSYPIVGFMVDMMYLAMAVIIGLVAQGIGQGDRVAEFQTYYMNASGWDLVRTVVSAGFSSWDNIMFPNLAVHGISGIGTLIGGMLKFFAFKSIGTLLGPFSPDLIFGLIITLGVLFTMIRILLLLLNSYIQLLIGLILGPLHLLFEAIPGRSAFSQWFLNIAANLVVYPTTVAVLMFAEFLTQMDMDADQLLTPPLTWMPGKGAFSAFLGLGVLFLAPTLIATVKKQFHPKPVLPMTAGTAFAPLTGGAQTAMGAASQFYYMKPILEMFKAKK